MSARARTMKVYSREAVAAYCTDIFRYRIQFILHRRVVPLSSQRRCYRRRVSASVPIVCVLARRGSVFQPVWTSIRPQFPQTKTQTTGSDTDIAKNPFRTAASYLYRRRRRLAARLVHRKVSLSIVALPGRIYIKGGRRTFDLPRMFGFKINPKTEPFSCRQPSSSSSSKGFDF